MLLATSPFLASTSSFYNHSTFNFYAILNFQISTVDTLCLFIWRSFLPFSRFGAKQKSGQSFGFSLLTIQFYQRFFCQLLFGNSYPAPPPPEPFIRWLRILSQRHFDSVVSFEIRCLQKWILVYLNELYTYCFVCFDIHSMAYVNSKIEF